MKFWQTKEHYHGFYNCTYFQKSSVTAKFINKIKKLKIAPTPIKSTPLTSMVPLNLHPMSRTVKIHSKYHGISSSAIRLQIYMVPLNTAYVKYSDEAVTNKNFLTTSSLPTTKQTGLYQVDRGCVFVCGTWTTKLWQLSLGEQQRRLPDLSRLSAPKRR